MSRRDRSRVLRSLAMVLALASLAACAKPEKPGVALKEVGVDLVYGKKVEVEPGATEGGEVGGLAAPSVVGEDLGGDDGLEPTPRPTSRSSSGSPTTAPRGACPEPDDDASVGDPAPTRVERPPAQGEYWTRLAIPGQEVRTGYRTIERAQINNDGSFEYRIVEPFNGQAYRFSVDPKSGMFLTEITLVQDGEPVTAAPSVPLRVANFPLLSGSQAGGEGTVDSVSADPRGAVFVYHGQPVGKEVVEVCSQLVEAFKLAWDLEVTVNGSTHHEVGEVWLRTQAGGWFVRSVLEVTGDFREAKETINALRVVPGVVR